MTLKHLIITILFLSLGTTIFAQYQIGHQAFAFDDPARNNRNVWGEVYYPATTAGDNVPVATGQFPLVVFGHGFSILWSEYDIWWQELVEDGYIVAFPRTEGGVFPFPDHGDFGQDLAFLVGAFNNTAGNDATSDFYQHFTNKNAIMGHSMGGGCSYLAVGNYGANVETMISLAAADTNPSAITAAASITVPVLTIAGSLDCVVQTNEAPIDIYNGLTSTPYKAYVEITGASHCQFGKASGGSVCTLGETCGGFMPKADQHTQMFLNSVPWLDYYLKGECARWQDFKNHLVNNDGITHTYLESGALPVPTVAISAPTLGICTGASTTLTANISSGYCDIVWELDGVVFNNMDESIAATMAGTYSVTVSNADMVSNFDNVLITTLAAPSTTINPSQSALNCNNNSVSLDAGNGFSNYSWSTNATSQTISTTSQGDYTVTITDGNGCTGTAAINITEDFTLPVANISSSIMLLDCNTSNTILDAGSSFNAYAWSNGMSNQTISVSSGGVYTVTVTGSNGCTSTTSIAITDDFAAPTPNINSGGTTELDCDNSSISLDAGNGYVSYSWSDGTTTQMNTVNSAGNYMVTVTSSNGCTGMTNINITQDNSLPVAVISSSASELDCNTGSITLDASNSTGTNLSYDWGNGSSSINMITSAGTYTVTITDGNNGCTSTSSITITEDITIPTVNISASEMELNCNTNSSDLDAGAGFTTYAWSDGSSAQILAVNTAGTYTVTVTSNNGCSAMNSITLMEDFATPFPSLSGDFDFCTGSGAFLELGNTYVSYQWSDGSTGSDLVVNTGGTYTVTVTAANGCTGTTSENIAEIPNPSITITEMNGILTANVVGGSFFQYEWYLNGNTINGATSDTHDANVTGSGDYSVYVINDGGCEEFSIDINVVITSTYNINASYGINIFPTIIENDINIQLENENAITAEINIYDLSGKSWKTKTIELNPYQTQQINTTELPQGMYIIQFSAEEGILSKKVVKK